MKTKIRKERNERRRKKCKGIERKEKISDF